ncbi:hypothetical protein, partial [Streptomyces sp. NPDC001919]
MTLVPPVPTAVLSSEEKAAGKAAPVDRTVGDAAVVVGAAAADVAVVSAVVVDAAPLDGAAAGA